MPGCIAHMAGLVVEEEVGLEFAQELALGQTTQEQRFVHLDAPIHQRANGAFMRWCAAGRDQSGADAQGGCAFLLQSVQSGYARVPASLDDSARMLGVSGWGLLRRVYAPLLKRSTAAALLLVLVDVMKELPATLVLRPFDTDTLAVMAHQLARDERLGEAALPALALVAVGLLPVCLLSRALRQR